MTSLGASIGDSIDAPPAPTQETWYDETIERYSNPRAFARKNQPKPEPELQKEISLVNPGGQNTNLEVCDLTDREESSRARVTGRRSPVL